MSLFLKFIRVNLYYNNVNKNVEMLYVFVNSFIIILKKIMLYIRICDFFCLVNGFEVIIWWLKLFFGGMFNSGGFDGDFEFFYLVFILRFLL